MKFPDVEVGKRLYCGFGDPFALGIGTEEIRGTAYIEGPLIFGNPEEFPKISANCMIGPGINTDILPYQLEPPLICGIPQDLSLYCIGNAGIRGNLLVGGFGNITAEGEVMSGCGDHVLSSKKNFDIPHPTKEGWRLRHTCPEGPSNDVYVRGRVTNKTEIELPLYWKDLVDIQSITVNLTPIGAHQDVIVKRWDEKKIYLQAKGGMPIDCFYHVYGTRTDGENLIAEYQGLTPNDYPGDNSEYNINI